MAIQYEWSGHSQLYADCPLDHLTFPFCTCRIFSTHYISFFIGRESRGPICIASKTASLAGSVGSCSHQYRRDEVFGVEETVVACKPLRPQCPCLPSERMYIALKFCILSRARCGAQCVSAPSQGQ